MRGVRDRGPRNLPIFKAHPFVEATGQDGVEVYRYYRAAFRYCRRAYQKHARKSQSTQSVRFFGGISCGGMLGLLATWRCLLLDIVQTGVTSWLDSQSALWPFAVSLSLLAKIVDHTPLAVRAYVGGWTAEWICGRIRVPNVSNPWPAGRLVRSARPAISAVQTP